MNFSVRLRPRIYYHRKLKISTPILCIFRLLSCFLQPISIYFNSSLFQTEICPRRKIQHRQTPYTQKVVNRNFSDSPLAFHITGALPKLGQFLCMGDHDELIAFQQSRMRIDVHTDHVTFSQCHHVDGIFFSQIQLD